MKTTFILAVVAAIVAVACGAPGVLTSPTDVDWVRIEFLVGEMEENYKNTSVDVTKIAMEVNSTIGRQIEEAFSTSDKEISVIFSKMQEEIKNQTLGGYELFDYLERTTDIFEPTMKEIYELVDSFPDRAYWRVSDRFSDWANLYTDIWFKLYEAIDTKLEAKPIPKSFLKKQV